MYRNKRKHQYDQIKKWIKSGKIINKTKLSKKLNITRVTLNKLLNEHEEPTFFEYGKPRLVVADKRKSFWNGHENKSQIYLILNELDIEIITSSDPTAKPNVERSFLDSQQWLPLELFNKNIFNLKVFNKNIDLLTTLHNKRFNKSFDKSKSSFTPINNEEIEENLNLWLYRKVTNGNTVSINNEHYIIVLKGKRTLFDDNAKIKILSNDIYKYYVFWRNKKITLKPLEDKYIVDYHSKEWNKIAFEKRKQISFNKILDIKQLRLEKNLKNLENYS